MPMFDISRDNNNDITLLVSKANAQTPEVKLVNDIKALYNNGNQILQVQSPMQLTGSVNCSELSKIQTTSSNVYADETLRLSNYNREVALAGFLEAYRKCGFDFNGENNFFPKPGNIHAITGQELTLDITDTAKSYDIYKLYERYHDKGKLSNLSELRAEHITVAGNSAAGLFGANNQPSAAFPYKVKGEVLGAIHVFAAFENLYEYTGNLNLPFGLGTNYKIKNFATESDPLGLGFDAFDGGVCFFKYAPGSVMTNGAVKIMRATASTSISAEYVDLRDLPIGDMANVQGGAKEVAFASPAAFKAKATGESMSLAFPRDINYANDNSGVAKLIGAASEGFGALYASARDTGVYGVLELQEWANGAPAGG
jgi:hypothetical protein